MVAEEFMADPVEFVGGNSGSDMPPDLGQRLSGDPPGDAHPPDRVRVLEVRFSGARVLPADILRPRDLPGYRPHRGDAARLERRCHGLKVECPWTMSSTGGSASSTWPWSPTTDAPARTGLARTRHGKLPPTRWRRCRSATRNGTPPTKTDDHR